MVGILHVSHAQLAKALKTEGHPHMTHMSEHLSIERSYEKALFFPDHH
jgi:hypothetical protein